MGRPKKEKTIVIRPPFLRPEVSDGQITVKIMDNGIQGELRRTKVGEQGVTPGTSGSCLHGRGGGGSLRRTLAGVTSCLVSAISVTAPWRQQECRENKLHFCVLFPTCFCFNGEL